MRSLIFDIDGTLWDSRAIVAEGYNDYLREIGRGDLQVDGHHTVEDIGIVLGLILGAVPLSLPGAAFPVKLGLAGGPIVVGILIGTYGPRMHLITYATRSANLMLRAFGLSLYLACLGLSSGGEFFSTAVSPTGLMWVGLGFLITLLPVVLVGVAAMRWAKIDFGSTCGMLCGSMANPMALNYANDTIPGDHASVAYATVYPLSMFLRVLLAQLVLMVFL